MMRGLLLSLAVSVCLTTLPALAQTAAEVDGTIDTLLGDHTKYREAFDIIQKAVAEGDGPALAEFIPYGTPMTVHGAQRQFDSEHDFYAAYDEVFTPDVVATVATQTWETLFVNADGVMFGAGEVWLNGVCRDYACAEFDVKIVAVQTIPD